MKPWLAAASVACVAVALSGCGFVASTPPRESHRLAIPPLVRVSPLVEREAQLVIRPVAAVSLRRRAEQLTVRVRNIDCEGLALGSGFAITPHLLVTNRHVLAGADNLEVNTWDGRDLGVPSAAVGVLADLGIATVNGTLPVVAAFGPEARQGDVVTVVGYPLGGPLTFSVGTVVDRVDGTPYGIPGPVMRLTARVEHGNSGGPVLDSHGRVVGIVFAIETETGLGLAIPADTVTTLARAGGFEQVPPCGEG